MDFRGYCNTKGNEIADILSRNTITNSKVKYFPFHHLWTCKEI